MSSEKSIPLENFNDLNLSPLLMKAIAELGYEKPSPIQAQALPILLGDPTDFLGLAATGTGKTAAFSIPMLEKTNLARKVVQTLILCPTRELALQITGQINLLGKYMGIKALPVYGGSSYSDQISGLRRGATIVVGTPGRIVDHMERGTLILDDVDTVILDEADEMISMGFKDSIELILNAVRKDVTNTWLFSATMSSEVRRVADQYLSKPKQVQVNKSEMLPEAITQLYYVTHEDNKPEVLCKLIDAADDFYGLVFCQTKSLVVDLTQYLNGRGYRVDCLHGDMDQNARERTMKSFRERRVSLLICTDVASRGIDVKDITHVLNYSIPRELDNYVHRIGRTARSGKSGFAMSLVTQSHKRLIPRIEQMTKRKMIEGKIPTRKEIGTKRVAKILAAFEGQTAFSKAVELMGEEWKASVAAMTQEEITGRFLVMLFPEIFAAREEANSLKSARIQPTVEAGGEPGQGKVIIQGDTGERSRSGGWKPRERSGGFGDSSESGDRSARSESSERKPWGEKRSLSGDRKPWGEKKSFGDKKPWGEKKSFGDKKPWGEKKTFGDKKPWSEEKTFGDKKPWGEKKSFGDKKPWGEKKPFGDKKPWGEKKPFGDKKPWGEKKTFDAGAGDSEKKSWSDRKSADGKPYKKKTVDGGFQPLKKADSAVTHSES